MPQSVVYAIHNRRGTIVYVGVTTDLRRRAKQHWTTRHNPRTPIEKWLATLRQRPQFSIMEEIDPGSSREREEHWLTELRPRFNIYESRASVRVVSDETRRRISESRKGVSPRPGTGALVSKGLTGIKRTQETKELMSASRKAWCDANSTEPVICEHCSNGPYRGLKGLYRHRGSCPPWLEAKEQKT